MDAIILQCPLFLQPFKLPISKCKGSHMGCGHCIGELLGNPCKKCEQTAMAAVVSGAMVQCPHEGCLSLVASNKCYDHYIACLHGSCGCTEALHTGCGFTGPPRELLAHLAVSHSIPVFRFQYGIPAWCMVRAPVLPQGHLFIGYRDEDGSVFGITVGTLALATVLSCVCIRSAACLWPRYTAQLLVLGPPAPAGTADFSTDTLMAVIGLTSTATPSAIALHQLTSFLVVLSRYMREARPHRLLPICICINKKIISE